MAKRNILGELMEGVAAMKAHRGGKLTLRSYKVDVSPPPKVDSKLLRDTRKRLRCSRAVFARKLRINERTLEKWEQGRVKPNAQAPRLFFSCANIRIPWIGWMSWPEDSVLNVTEPRGLFLLGRQQSSFFEVYSGFVAMLREKIQEFAPTNEGERFPFRKLVGIWAVVCGRY